MKHEHHCKHEIEHCAHCDTVSCSKCGKEWGAAVPCTLNHFPTYYPPVFIPHIVPSWNPWPITWSGTTTISSGSAPLGEDYVVMS